MTLDFSRSSFITPYGMIFLYALVSHLREKYPDSPVRVIFPVGDDLFGYSCRMHLPQMLKEIGDVTISPEPYTVRERDRRASLQELKLADLPHNDAADEEADYLSQIIRRQTNFQVDTLEIIDTGLSELLSNVGLLTLEKTKRSLLLRRIKTISESLSVTQEWVFLSD